MASLDVTVEPNSQTILGVARIQAPLEKVFHAYTDADLFKKWFVRGHDSRLHSYEAKNGGSWHIDELMPDGTSYSFCGSFHEVAVNERIIWTFEFLGIPERGHVSLERMDFIPIDELTTEIRTTSTFFSVADRDAMASSDMEAGWLQSLQALEKLINKEGL